VPSHWKSDALCLRITPYSNTSLVVGFFTRERGRVGCMAKGARRKGSALQGELDVLHRVELVAIERKRSALHTLGEVSTLDTYRPVRHDLRRLHAALYIVEILREAAPESEPLPQLYDLSVRALGRVAHNQTFNPLTVAIFELRALKALGFAPRLDRCAGCERALPDEQAARWAPILGGAACAECAATDRDQSPLPSAERATLRALAGDSPPKRLAAPAMRRVRAQLNAFWSARLERRLRLAPYLDR